MSRRSSLRRNSLAALALAGSCIQLTDALPSRRSSVARGSVCGSHGYSEGTDSYQDTSDGSYSACSAACSKQSDCKSFAFGNGECHLFNVSVYGNLEEESTSPYTFYDIACPKSTTSPSTSTSATPRKTSIVSTTTSVAKPTTLTTTTKQGSTTTCVTTTTKAASTAPTTSSKTTSKSTSTTTTTTTTPVKTTTTTTKLTTTTTKPATTIATTTTKPATTIVAATTVKQATTGSAASSTTKAPAPTLKPNSSVDTTFCKGSTIQDPGNKGCGCTYQETCGSGLVPGEILEAGLSGVTYNACIAACDARQSDCIGVTYQPFYGECWLYKSSTGTYQNSGTWFAKRQSCSKACPSSS